MPVGAAPGPPPLPLSVTAGSSTLPFKEPEKLLPKLSLPYAANSSGFGDLAVKEIKMAMVRASRRGRGKPAWGSSGVLYGILWYKKSHVVRNSCHVVILTTKVSTINWLLSDRDIKLRFFNEREAVNTDWEYGVKTTTARHGHPAFVRRCTELAASIDIRSLEAALRHLSTRNQ